MCIYHSCREKCDNSHLSYAVFVGGLVLRLYMCQILIVYFSVLQRRWVSDSLSLSLKGIIKPSRVSALRLWLHSSVFGAYSLLSFPLLSSGFLHVEFLNAASSCLPASDLSLAATLRLSVGCCFNWAAHLRQTKHNNSLRGSCRLARRHLDRAVGLLPFLSITLKVYNWDSFLRFNLTNFHEKDKKVII